MKGQAYLGFRKTAEGKTYHDTEREGRRMGPPCTSRFCERSKVRFCNSIIQQERQEIFSNYWNNMNWDQRKVFIVNNVLKTPVKRRVAEGDESRRNDTLTYYLTVNGKKMKVCQNMFLQTLGIKKWTVRYWLDTPGQSTGTASSFETSHDNIGERRVNPIQIEFLNKFFDSLPKLPAHYCRSTSTSLYLETTIVSKTQLYDLYKNQCQTSSAVPLSRFTFDKIFKQKNLAINAPKKDKCDLCSAFEIKNGTVTEEEYNKHIIDKEQAREQKQIDKAKAIQGLHYAFTQDVEAVKLAPCLNASSMYFKTKLAVHNFTMYNLGNKDVKCYWFDETASSLEASTYASCIIDNLKTMLAEDKNLLFYGQMAVEPKIKMPYCQMPCYIYRWNPT
ncbi:hypothetical protein J6590_108362 [Homalodisca vitripennis]|nr:hypothetical protein J6590_108362 [Homalodisca vitripennis]